MECVKKVRKTILWEITSDVLSAGALSNLIIEHTIRLIGPFTPSLFTLFLATRSYHSWRIRVLSVVINWPTNSHGVILTTITTHKHPGSCYTIQHNDSQFVIDIIMWQEPGSFEGLIWVHWNVSFLFPYTCTMIDQTERLDIIVLLVGILFSLYLWNSRYEIAFTCFQVFLYSC